MQVFEVVMEDCRNEEIKNVIQYVSAKNLKEVTDVFDKEAEETDMELKSVRYVLSVCRQI